MIHSALVGVGFRGVLIKKMTQHILQIQRKLVEKQGSPSQISSSIVVSEDVNNSALNGTLPRANAAIDQYLAHVDSLLSPTCEVYQM